MPRIARPHDMRNTFMRFTIHARATSVHPLASDLLHAAQRESPKAHHLFDDAKHRLRGLLAQGIRRTPRLGRHAMRHPRHGVVCLRHQMLRLALHG
jgi:hypothetical protein